MPSVECQGCGATVSKTYARVFGDQDNVLHACSNCSSHGNIAGGAGASPERTPRVHRPGESEPVPASLHEEGSEDAGAESGPGLESLLEWEDSSEDSAGFTHEDQQFQQLVAE